MNIITKMEESVFLLPFHVKFAQSIFSVSLLLKADYFRLSFQEFTPLICFTSFGMVSIPHSKREDKEKNDLLLPPPAITLFD